MKKALITLIITILLLPLVAFVQLEPCQANLGVPFIQITSPSNYGSEYELINPSSTVIIEVEVRLLQIGNSKSNSGQVYFDPQQYSPQLDKVFYTLDGVINTTLVFPKTGTQFYISSSQQGISLLLHQTLFNITNGVHTLQAFAIAKNGEIVSDQITFMVDTNFIIPSIKIISPQNQTYSINEVPLTCIINGEFASIHYKIDYQTGHTFDGNTTLTNLSEGSHRVKVWGISNRHYLSTSETSVYISVNSTIPQITSTLNEENRMPPITNIIIFLSIVLIIAVIAVVLYLAKKSNTKQSFL